MTNIMKAALDGLNREIFAGVEFPDALHRILLAFPEVTQEELTAAYGQQP
jgi:Flp pilus assembly protein TadB